MRNNHERPWSRRLSREIPWPEGDMERWIADINGTERTLAVSAAYTPLYEALLRTKAADWIKSMDEINDAMAVFSQAVIKNLGNSLGNQSIARLILQYLDSLSEVLEAQFKKQGSQSK